MKHLTQKISKVISTIFPEITENSLLFQPTRKEFEGELTIVIFPLVKQLKKSPNEIANQLGEAIVGKVKEVKSFQLVSGFLNISFTNKYWLQQFSEINNQTNWGIAKPSSSGRTILVEYSSPNTNKPLHLGHLRNNFWVIL